MPYASLWAALGGLGIFILGMKLMSEGLQKLAGDRIRGFLEKLTGTRLSSAFIGSCLSASLQSSSAAAILVIGFINAGLLSLYQALAVMMGTGIGTTIAIQFIAFRVSIVAQPLIFVGAVLKFFCRRRRWVYAGDLLLGAGLVFLGLQTMETGFVPFTEKAIGAGLHQFQLPWRLVSVILGAAIAFMLQSGSAAVGVAIALTGSGLVPFDHGFYMVIGEVLGTTLIASIATISGSLIAKRTVIIYLLINISAIILVVVFPDAFKALVYYITPGSIGRGLAPPSSALPRLLANSHTIFSILTMVIFLPPLGFFVRSAKSILPGRQKGVEFEACCKFIDRRVLNTPSLAMLQAKNELNRMAEITSSMYDDAIEQFFRFDAKRAIRIRDKEEALDFLQREISGFLVKLSQQSLSTETALSIPTMLTVVNILEHMGDQNETIVGSLLRKKENKILFSGEAMGELKSLAVRVGDIVHLALLSSGDYSHTALADARALKDDIDSLQEFMHSSHIKRLSEGRCTVMAGVAYSDIIISFDKIAEYAFSIIKQVRRLSHE
jgi:phosphate:Na+ symporter